MNRINKCLIIIVTFLVSASLYASIPGLSIIKSNTDYLVINYKPVIIKKSLDEKKPDIIDYSDIVLNSKTNKEYSIIKIPITVPSESDFKISEIQIRQNLINQNFVYPSKNVSLVYSGIARNRHIAHIEIINSEFSEEINKYLTPESYLITIKFNNKNNKANKATLKDDDDFNFTINHNETRNWVINSNIKLEKKNIDKIQGLSSGNWIKIPIESEGIYRIDLTQLSALGYNITKNDIASIKIFGNGGTELSEIQSVGQNNNLKQQNIYVNTSANGDLESIIFYAASADGFVFSNNEIKHFINHYSTKNYYLLTWGGDPGKRANAQSVFEGQPQNKPDIYTHRIFYEEELSNAFISGSGRQWFGRTIFPATFTNILHNLYRLGKIEYKVTVAHRASNDGQFKIYESTNYLGNISLEGISKGIYIDAYRQTIKTSLSAENITSDNRSVLKLNYSNSDISTSLPFFDAYEIAYPRSFVAIGNELNFWSPIEINGKTEFNINNFGNEIFGFNVSDRSNPIPIKNLSTTGGLMIFRDSLIKNKPNNYFISSNIKKPILEKMEYVGLRENISNIDLIIISPSEFFASADAFKEYRSKKDNLKAVVVKTENIFNEFGSGISDPTAIRDFISYVYHNSEIKPHYVVLWGAGHYDYKNISTQVKNYIPPFETEDDEDRINAITSSCIEDYFIRVDGDDNLPDLSMGRLPIHSAENGFLILDKIKTYENGSSKDIWRDNILLMADDSNKGDVSGGDGDLHTSQSESLSDKFIPLDFLQKKIYLVEYPKENIPNGIKKPAVTDEMLNTINNYGTLLLNWVGHGNPRVWAHETVLERETTIPLFQNKEKLFFLTAATCDFGRFDMPEVRCGSEETLLKKDGGSIGVFSSTRVVLSVENAAINKVLFEELFKRDVNTGNYRRLGDIMNSVKSIRYSANDEKFFLFGDPTLKLNIPELVSTIETINGKDITTSKDTIKIQALTEVKITGTIRNYLDNSLVKDFNGYALLSVFDADKLIKAIDIDESEHYIDKFGGALNKSSAIVKDGKFEFSFLIPKDISFSKNLGRIFVYAYNNVDFRTSKGNFNKVKFVGNDTITSIDANPPKIKLYLENRDFKKGDIVSQSPLLIADFEDDYGINASGTGIGHLIEAWIDDNPNSIDLTSKFNSATDGTKNGSIETLLSAMNAGMHKIKLRAWNVYNKYSVAETEFKIISESDEIYISDFLVYPNPFIEGITIKFNHNMTKAFNYNLNIYNIAGQLVRNISNSKVSGQFEYKIYWDGLDMNNNTVPSGNYIFSLEIDSYYKLNTTKYFGVMDKVK